MPTRRTGLLLGTAALAIAVVAGAFFLWGGPDTLNARTTCREPAPLRFEIASKIERSELGTTVFGEGLTILNDQIYQLTWQDHQVFVYDLAAKRQRAMRNPREGWGLTNDGTSLIFSDGGPSFYYVDPQTFAVRRTVKVRSTRPGDIVGLNELELVRGRLYGNIFTTWSIVRIDPASGCIDAVADMRGLRDRMSADEKALIDTDGGNYVLNGIAYDNATGTFYVTGKRWKSIFSGRFVEGGR